MNMRLLAPLAVAAILLAGCSSAESSAENGSDEVAAVDSTSTTVDSAGDTTVGVETTVAPKDPSAPIAVDVAYNPDAEPILIWFSPFEPGTYRTGALGTPMSFTTIEPLNTQVNGDGFFVISDISSRAPDDRDLVFLRVGAFSDPAAPQVFVNEQTPWPNDDFLGWLENLNDGVRATEPVQTTVNGLAAIRVDLSVSDDIECGFFPGECVGFITNNGQDLKALNKGASYRVWIIDQADEDPLAIVDGIARDEDAPWYGRSDVVMDSIAFGEISPNPVQGLVPGTSQLNVLGGVEVIIPDNVSELTNGGSRVYNRWNGRGYAAIPVTERPALIDFVNRPHDIDGNPLGSVDEVVDELTAAGVSMTELDAITIDGVEARVFDVTSEDVRAILLRHSPLDLAADNFGWDAPAASRMWLIDHPERGVMMIDAKAFEGVDEFLPVVIELAEAIVGSMTFTAAG